MIGAADQVSDQRGSDEASATGNKNFFMRCPQSSKLGHRQWHQRLAVIGERAGKLFE